MRHCRSIVINPSYIIFKILPDLLGVSDDTERIGKKVCIGLFDDPAIITVIFTGDSILEFEDTDIVCNLFPYRRCLLPADGRRLRRCRKGLDGSTVSEGIVIYTFGIFIGCDNIKNRI